VGLPDNMCYYQELGRGGGSLGLLGWICVLQTSMQYTSIFLMRFLKAREAEMQVISTEISEEKSHLQVCNDAIFNLEIAVPEGKQIIRATEDNLSSFIDIQSRLGDIKVASQKTMKNESTTKNLYADLRSWTDKSIMRISDLIDEQIEVLKKDIRTLWDKIRQLEMELSGWRSSKILSETSIKRLGISFSDIENELQAGRQAFRPIRKVPSDVWIKIFELVIQQIQDTYLKDSTNSYGMRPPMFSLSQVCQHWRYLVQSDARCCNLVYIAPFSVWREDEYDVVTKSAQKSTLPITVLTNLSQSLYFSYQHNYRYDSNGNHITRISPHEGTVFDGKKYTLLVSMNYDDSDSMSRLSHLPLRHTSSLIFHGRCDFPYGYLFSFVSNFPNVKSFSITSENSSSLPNVTISSYFPQLFDLSVKVKSFPQNWYLNNSLPATLQKLQLRNDMNGHLPVVSSDIDLPHLRVLEIMAPGTYLLDRLTAKALKSLTLYGPKDYTALQFTPSNKASEVYNQLLHLKFEDWKIGSSGYGAALVFRDLIDRTPSLRTLKFSGSVVDGGTLRSILNEVLSDAGDPAKSRDLQEITLSYPTGITNDECEEIKKLVKRVKIYM
jgi:hypothetical protein